MQALQGAEARGSTPLDVEVRGSMAHKRDWREVEADTVKQKEDAYVRTER